MLSKERHQTATGPSSTKLAGDGRTMVLAKSGKLHKMLESFAGPGFLKTLRIQTTKDEDAPDSPDVMLANALEQEWAALSSAILDYRVRVRPRFREAGLIEPPEFPKLINLLIDIGTDKMPSMIGLIWLRQNVDQFLALSEEIQYYLSYLEKKHWGKSSLNVSQ